MMRREDVQTAVVHVGEKLRLADRGAVVSLDGDPPGLASVGTQAIAEARELDLEPAVVPGDFDDAALFHPLVVAQQPQAKRHAAAVLRPGRELQDLRSLGADQTALFHALAP